MEEFLTSREIFPTEIAIMAIIIGLIFCFFGKKLFRTLCALVGAIIFASIALAVTHIILIFYQPTDPIICYASAIIIAGIIGGFMGIKTCEMLVCTAVASLIAVALYGLGVGILPALIVFLVAVIIAYILLEKILIAITSFAGASAVAMGAYSLMQIHSVAVAIIIILTLLGIHVQRKIDED